MLAERRRGTSRRAGRDAGGGEPSETPVHPVGCIASVRLTPSIYRQSLFRVQSLFKSKHDKPTKIALSDSRSRSWRATLSTGDEENYPTTANIYVRVMRFKRSGSEPAQGARCVASKFASYRIFGVRDAI